MAHIKLEVKKREISGNQCRKLRREGILPAVVYGKDQESLNLQLPASVFYKTYKEAGKTNVIDLDIESNITPVIIQSIDIDPVFNEARHVDFLAVDLKQKVHAQVPLVFTGEPIGVKEQGLVLVTNLEEIEVEALPDDIPSEIEISVEDLKEIGDSITVDDLPKSSLYEILSDAALSLAVLTAQSTEEDFASDEEEEILEGEEGEGSEEAAEGGADSEGGEKEADAKDKEE